MSRISSLLLITRLFESAGGEGSTSLYELKCDVPLGIISLAYITRFKNSSLGVVLLSIVTLKLHYILDVT